jgi:hypothetical protein
LGCLKTRHAVNITRTPWTAAPSLPIPDTTYPNKRTTVSSQNPILQTPSSPKHPGTDAREDTPHQKPREITVEHATKALLPPTKPEHDATLCAFLGSVRHEVASFRHEVGSFRHEASTSVSSARRRRQWWTEGNRTLTPVRASYTSSLRSHERPHTLVA